MLNAALAQGNPTMVIAMTTAAITQPSAIHKPPKTIQSRLRRREMMDIAGPRWGCEAASASVQPGARRRCSGTIGCRKPCVGSRLFAAIGTLHLHLHSMSVVHDPS